MTQRPESSRWVAEEEPQNIVMKEEVHLPALLSSRYDGGEVTSNRFLGGVLDTGVRQNLFRRRGVQRKFVNRKDAGLLELDSGRRAGHRGTIHHEGVKLGMA